MDCKSPGIGTTYVLSKMDLHMGYVQRLVYCPPVENSACGAVEHSQKSFARILNESFLILADKDPGLSCVCIWGSIGSIACFSSQTGCQCMREMLLWLCASCGC